MEPMPTPATPPVSPQMSPHYQPPWQPAATYVSASGRAKAAVVCLGLMAALDGVCALLEFPMLEMLQNAEGGVVDEATMIAWGLGLILFGLTYMGVWIACVICYCMWVHRAHKNLPALGATGLAYTPGWAVGWYFVPFAQLFKPFGAMKELWKASGSATVSGGPEAWKAAPTPGHLPLWFGTWIGANLLARTSMFGIEDPAMLTMMTGISVLSSAVFVVSAIVLIQLIRTIDYRQQRRAAALGAGAPVMSYAHAA
jgi:hypothetical protein